MKKNILSLYSLPHFGAGELFKILKGNAIKVLLSICSANLENSEVDTGSEKASFHSKPKEEQCKNVQAIVQLCSFHTLARLCSKSFKLSFSSMSTENFRFASWVSQRQRTQRSKFQHPQHYRESQDIPEKYLPLLHRLC